MSRRTAYWSCQLAGWSFYGVVNVAISAAFGQLTARAALFGVAVAALGLAATHGLRAVIRRRGWLGLPVGPLAARVALASVATAALMVAVVVAGSAALMSSADLAASGVPFRAFVMITFGNWSFLVGGWSALYVGVHLAERWRDAERARADAEAAQVRAEAERWRLQSAVAEAELRALQAQVHPHFLFNSLNTVRALVALDPERAQQAVTDLADLLRYSLAAGRRPTASLRDELDAVEAYLAIERLRFEHRLAASVDADPAALDVRVPPFVVQTLVENGIKHGVARRPEGGLLRVCARVAGEDVRITVENTGRLDDAARHNSVLSDGTRAGGGLGLANAAERLRRLCARATLTVRQSGADMVTAEVVLPSAVAASHPVSP